MRVRGAPTLPPRGTPKRGVPPNLLRVRVGWEGTERSEYGARQRQHERTWLLVDRRGLERQSKGDLVRRGRSPSTHRTQKRKNFFEWGLNSTERNTLAILEERERERERESERANG